MLHEYVGRDEAIGLMEYVDSVLCEMGGSEARLYTTENSDLKNRCKTICIAGCQGPPSGNRPNVQILGQMYEYAKDRSR